MAPEEPPVLPPQLPPVITPVYIPVPEKKKTSGCAIFLGIILGLGVLGFILVVSNDPSSPPSKGANVTPTPDTPDLNYAWVLAEDWVKHSLKAPSTADFGSVFGDYQPPDIGVYTDGTFKVKIWVDAQNSFGAKIRSHFILRMRYDGNKRWTLLGGVQPDPDF